MNSPRIKTHVVRKRLKTFHAKEKEETGDATVSLSSEREKRKSKQTSQQTHHSKLQYDWDVMRG